MIQINCMIATPLIRDYADKLNKPVVVVTNAVATWLSENNTPNMPTLEQIKELFKQAELEKKDYYLSVPNAITTNYEPNGNPITHVGNRIIMMNLPDSNALEYFYNMFNLPELRELVLEPQEAYYFMLWREQQFIVNNWDKTEDNIKKASQEAINRLKEYKRRNPQASKKLSEKHHNTVNTINNYISWVEQHVTFDEGTHTYYIDGVPADFSVSQYYQAVYNDHPDFGDKYAESPAIGNTMDAIWRDYFDDNQDIYIKSYPNMNDSRKAQVLRDLDRFKTYLDGRFGKGLYKVITNPNFHLVSRMGDKVIAGTPDMIVIDMDGNIHIFDMKAKSHGINQTYNGILCNDRRDYTAQLNLYRTMIDSIPSQKGKVASIQLIWMDTNITSMRHNGNTFTVDKATGEVTVSNSRQNVTRQPIASNPEWRTPSLNSSNVEKSIISLGIMSKVAGLTIPNMQSYNSLLELIDADYSLAIVAPYFRQKLTSINKEDLEKATRKVKNEAQLLANILGLTIESVDTLGGTYLGSSEISYLYRINSEDQEKIDLFAALMGDLSAEYQDAVIAANDVTKEQWDNQTENKAIELVYSVPQSTTIEDIEKTLRETNIEGSSFNFTNNFLSITAFSEEEAIEINNKLKNTKYEPKKIRLQNSRYLDNERRRTLYQTWISRNKQTLSKSKLYNACSKALAICEAATRFPEANLESERLKAALDAAKQWEEQFTPKNNQMKQETNLPTSDTKINIYAGTNENADLSNFAERPFKLDTTQYDSKGNELPSAYYFKVNTPSGRDTSAGTIGITRDGEIVTFRTVEGAFQAAKLNYLDYQRGYTKEEIEKLKAQGKDGDSILRKLANANGNEARRIGKSLEGLNTELWDKDSSAIMKELLKASFMQNPQTLQRLLSTGNAVLTHTQDKGTWGTEFPKLLMEVREELRKLTEGNNSGSTENKVGKSTESKVTKIISGGQTGVDTIGLQVAKELGIETGGTAPKGFLRETGIDNEDIKSYGLTEISDEQQADYTKRTGKKDAYTGRTELNVRNSDGTVYFSTDEDSAGKIATKRAADRWNKPFIENPTAEQLSQWIANNNIQTLNVAGNRGSKLKNGKAISKVLKDALLHPVKQEVKPTLANNQTQSSQEGVPKYIETTKYLPYNRPDMDTDRTRFTVKETPQTKLSREFSPNERMLRVEGLARDFSRAIDNATESLINDLQNQLTEARENKDSFEALRIQGEILALTDEKSGRQEVIKRHSPMQLALDVKQEYQDIVNLTPEQAIENYGNKGIEIQAKCQKVLDNFYPLLDEATVLIEQYEGLRLIYEDTGDSTTDRGALLAKSQGELDIEEEEFSDDEEGNRANGSEGWSFKARFVNPHSTVTNRVKRILSNIMYQGVNGLENDDLGKPRYMPEVIVYGTLINELVNMTSSDDFAVKDDEGNYSFPALEAMALKYSWIEQIILELEDSPNLISQFYAAFRKEFIPYWMQYFEGKQRKSKALNRTLAEDSTMGDLYAAYNKGIRYSKTSIYDVLGRPIKENAESIKKKVDDVYTILTTFKESQHKSLIANIIETNKALGINIEPSLIEGIIGSEAGEGVVRNWANATSFILRQIIDGKVPENAHMIDFFKDQYESIARVLGSVSELSNVLSFREGDKSYYSITASNFLYTTVKKLKGKDFKDYIDDEYRQFKWFYNENFGGWLNGWIEELLEDSETRNQLELREHVFYKNSRKQLVEYNQWTPQDIENIFLAEYWSIPANRSTKKQYAMFNFPIFSDTEQATFIKFSKFSGAHYKDKIIEGLRKVMLQELYRIKLVRDRKAAHAPEIMYFDKNGQKFQFFPRFNEEGSTVLQDCITFVDNNDLDGLNNYLRSVLREEMNLQFQEYMRDSKLDKEGLKEYLVQEGIMKNSENIDKYIEEYYWNNAYAQTQILQLTIIDPALYKNGNDLQKRFKEITASGTKLFTNSKYGRKIERTIYLKDLIGVSTSYNNIKDVTDRAVAEGRIQTYDRDNILYLFREVNATDAQAYRTSSSYRAVIDMLQGWSDEMEKALQNFKEGTWDMADFNMVWQTLKPFMFTHIAKNDGLGGKIKVGHQNKNSEFLLLVMYNLVSQAMGKSDVITGLNEFMEDHNIDVAQFISAVKTGGETVVDITYYPPVLEDIKQDSKRWSQLEDIVTKELGKDKISKMSDIDIFRTGQELLLTKGVITQEEYNKNIDEIMPTKDEVIEMLEQQVIDNNSDNGFKENVVHELPYEDYVVQQPTPEHLFDATSVFGSQFRNLITSDLPEDFTMRIGGKTLNKEQTIRLYQGCIVENLLEAFQALKGEFADIESLHKFLVSQVKGNPKYGRDMLNALEIIEYVNPLDSKIKKTFNIPWNAPNITDVLQELALSSFKNRITKQYIKGGACIAVSNFGFTNELKLHYNKEGDKTSGIAYMDCYLPWYSKQYFEPFLTEVTKTIEVEENGVRKKKTVTYQELDYSKMPEDLKKIIGFRIPTENKYSMFPLRVAGFLPQQNGSSIMLPMEATTLSGMDFK